jgi:hypothetical protein
VDWFPASKRGRAKFSLVFSDIISWAHEEASRGRRGYKPVRGTRNKIASVMAARTVNARKAKLKSLNR